MTISNISDRSVVDAMRNLDARLARIESQLSTFIKNNSLSTYHSALLGLSFADSGHSGFASSSDLTSHTGTANIHFLESAIDHDNILNGADASHIHNGTSAPSEVAGMWIDTTGGTAAYKAKLYNGAAWVEFLEF